MSETLVSDKSDCFINFINERECGKIFLTAEWNLVFHCTLCENKCNGFLEYENHLANLHYSDYKLGYDVKKSNYAKNSIKLLHSENLESVNDISLLEEVNLENVYDNNKSNVTEKDCNVFVVNGTEAYPNSQDENVLEESEVKLEELKRARKIKIISTIESKVPEIKKRKYPRAKEASVCPVCNKVLSKNTHLKTHMRRHTDSKNYKCSFCLKASFFTRTELNTHERIHNGERPYLCTACGNAFTTSSKLSAHIKQKHSRQRDKQCSICNMAFYSSVLLKNHMVMHTDERPFQCDLCESKFKRRKGLLSHLKSHENKKEFECDLCLARFNQKCNLNAHRKNKHAIAFEKKSVD